MQFIVILDQCSDEGHDKYVLLQLWSIWYYWQQHQLSNAMIYFLNWSWERWFNPMIYPWAVQTPSQLSHTDSKHTVLQKNIVQILLRDWMISREHIFFSAYTLHKLSHSLHHSTTRRWHHKRVNLKPSSNHIINQSSDSYQLLFNSHIHYSFRSTPFR